MPRRTARSLPPVNWLRAFEAAARHVGFAAAASELGVTPAAVSQQVRLLEQHLGRLLFHRLPRGLELAEAGKAYLPLVHEAFERLAAGTAEIFGMRASDRLTLRTTPAFALLWLAPRLARFRARHPAIALRITSSIWPAEFPDPGIDLEVRYGGGDWPGLAAERLAEETVLPVCSPALRAGPPRLRRPEDLARHTLLHTIGFREGWPLWLARAGVAERVEGGRGLEFDTAAMTMDLAARGLGVALGRSLLAADLLAAGRLVAPFDLALPAAEAFHLVAPAGRPAGPAAAAFRAWLLAEAATPSGSAAATPRRGRSRAARSRSR